MRARARRSRLRRRLIVSTVLVAALGLSTAALVIAMRPPVSGGQAPKIDLPQYASASATPGSTSLGAPSTMIPRIPRLSSDVPAGIINLTNWKLTLPTGDDEPVEVTQPELTQFRDPRYFHVDPVGDGVVFRAPVGGATTGNSEYPRSELREMTASGKKQASWSG